MEIEDKKSAKTLDMQGKFILQSQLLILHSRQKYEAHTLTPSKLNVSNINVIACCY